MSYPTERTHKCPECGVEVPKGQGQQHAREHWPDRIEPYPQHQLAMERQRELLEFDDEGHY